MANGSNSERELEALIQRVERLEEEKAKLDARIADIFADARITGFSTASIHAVLQTRKTLRDLDPLYRNLV